MISLTNYDFQWARSELVIIYPEVLNNLLFVHVYLSWSEDVQAKDHETRCGLTFQDKIYG